MTRAIVFPTVAVVTVGRGNYIILAFTAAERIESIRARMLRAAAGGPAQSIASAAAVSVQEVDTSAAGVTTFTDDHSPIEGMTRRMLRERRNASP